MYKKKGPGDFFSKIWPGLLMSNRWAGVRGWAGVGACSAEGIQVGVGILVDSVDTPVFFEEVVRDIFWTFRWNCRFRRRKFFDCQKKALRKFIRKRDTY